MKRVAMQRLCDSTPEYVPVKGGMVPFVAKRIIITSNSPPSQWWPNIGLGPMERRLTGNHGTVVHMTQPWVSPVVTPNVANQPNTLADAIDKMLTAPNWSPSEEWAMYGTPDDGPADMNEDPHEQDPLSRCFECHRRTRIPELCEECIERINRDYNGD